MTQLHRHDLRHRGQGARADLRTVVTGSCRMRALHPTWMKSGSPSNEQSSWVSQVPTVGLPRCQQTPFPNKRSCQMWSVSMLCGRPARPPTTALAPAAGPTARHACCCSRAIVLATLQSVHDHAMSVEAVQPPTHTAQLSPAHTQPRMKRRWDVHSKKAAQQAPRAKSKKYHMRGSNPRPRA